MVDRWIVHDFNCLSQMIEKGVYFLQGTDVYTYMLTLYLLTFSLNTAKRLSSECVSEYVSKIDTVIRFLIQEYDIIFSFIYQV